MAIVQERDAGGWPEGRGSEHGEGEILKRYFGETR